jgi:hypothetical protein
MWPNGEGIEDHPHNAEMSWFFWPDTTNHGGT